MTAITTEGFVRTRLDERQSQLAQALQLIFGYDINVDADSIDGQTIGVYAESISNLDQLAEVVYQSFNPQSATGAALSRLVQLNGIRRIGGTHSTVDLRCVGSEGTVIPAGSLVKSAANSASWTTLADLTIGSTGEGTVSAQAVDLGAVVAESDTLTKIDTPIYGWQTVTNPLVAVVGRNEETDEELRIRRAKSTSTPALAIVDGIYGALANLANVKHARVYENDQDTVDSVTGLPAHSIRCVVDGGDLNAIAQQIWLRKTAGTTTIGDINVAIQDSQGFSHNIKLDRPTYVDIAVKVYITKRPGFPVDADVRIKNAIISYAALNYDIGTPVIASRLYDAVNTVPNHVITALYISRYPTTPTSSDTLVLDLDELAQIQSGNITLIEV